MNTQKTIFITGTSSGLGRASTKLFSSQAWRVIATMRGQDAGKEAELKKLPGVKVLPLDVAEPAQIIDCESMAFELKRFGIGMKTIEPGGMKTDFFTRSFDTGRHAAYEGLVERVMDAIADPKCDRDVLDPRSDRRGRVRSRDRRQGPAPVRGRCRRQDDLCDAAPARRRSVPQRDGPAVLRVRLQRAPPANRLERLVGNRTREPSTVLCQGGDGTP